MVWIVCLILSVVCFTGAVVAAGSLSKTKYKSGRLLDSTKVMLLGVVGSSILLFIPIYTQVFQAYEKTPIEIFLISVHNTIRLFVVDGDFEFIIANIKDLPDVLLRCYMALFAVFFVAAPLLTFGFVLSFFKNLSAYKNFMLKFQTDAYIFSELNEKSLELARSIKENRKKKCVIIFTDVFENNDEGIFELVESAKELGAIRFKKDIVTVNFRLHSKASKLSFFTIGADESENISQSLKLIEQYKYRENTDLYIFSTRVESEILLENSFKISPDEEGGKEAQIKVRRVNEVQSLILRTLYEDGYRSIFESALAEQDGIRQINAVVIGMGQHGTEMTKALAWFCQMDGYRAQIDSFDIDPSAEDRFVSLCPELMSPQLNGQFDIIGETKYKITVHPGVDVDTKSFDDCIADLPATTYVFVALGSDEKNIQTAVKLRSILLRRGSEPVIQAVVCNSEKNQALNGVTNFKNQEYKIDFIGDMKTSYSEAVILHSDVEEEALKRHLKWGKESEFWQYDYNYKSSVASAIHRKMKLLCKIPGIEKEPGEREESEKVAIRILEHARWNAYMRSEGYVYGGTIEPEGRNDIAKMHNFLVPFYELPEKEQIKDDD